jgi:GNAT superfamily N-acetyltransferase
MDDVRIEPMRPEHGAAVLAIYEAGIATGNASFETQTPDWPTWDSKHLPDHRFVALEKDEVRGWIAASPTSDRCVYTGVVEESIYIAPLARGRGIGVRLMEHKEKPLLLFFVMDTGPLVSEHLRQVIFEPGFVCNPAASERTGRDLYKVRDFAITHAGSVWVDSKSGKTCTFFLRVRPDGVR